MIKSVYNVFCDSHSRKKRKIFSISFLQESRKTTGPLYLYLNLHQTIFIWNHCLENFLQGGKHYNLFLNAFCFKLSFRRLFLTLSCCFPESKVELLVFLSTLKYYFSKKFGFFLLLENTSLYLIEPSCPSTICSPEFLHVKILRSYPCIPCLRNSRKENTAFSERGLGKCAGLWKLVQAKWCIQDV